MTRIATLCLVVVGVLIGMKRFKTGDGSYSIKGATSAPSSRDVPAPSASSAAPASVISKSPRPNIPAHIIRDGKLMPQLAAEYAQQFLEDDPNWQPPRPLTCCTMCSGTDCSYLATRALEHVIPGFQMRHAFSCEIIDYKQDFIRHVLAHKPGRTKICDLFNKKEALSSSEQEQLLQLPCVFKDMADLYGARAEECPCHMHFFKKKGCRVRNAEWIFIGFSCKDISRMNANRDRDSLGSSKSSPGGSSTTFWHLMSFIDSHPEVCVVTVENVDNMSNDVDDEQEAESSRANFDVFLAEMANRGFDVSPIMFDATEFAIPARRRRLYFQCVRATSSLFRKAAKKNGMSGVFAKMIDLLEKCKRAPATVEDTLFDDDSPDVQDVLNDWKKAPPSEERGWTKLHQQMYDQHFKGAFGRLKLNRATLTSPWIVALNERQRDALRFWSHKDPAKSLFDLSQNINRLPKSSVRNFGDTLVEVAPTVMPNWRLWSTKRHRLVTGTEALMLQGFPVEELFYILEEFRNHQKHSLAGNAFTLTVVLALVASFVHSVEWFDDRSETTASSALTAGALMQLKAIMDLKATKLSNKEKQEKAQKKNKK